MAMVKINSDIVNFFIFTHAKHTHDMYICIIYGSNQFGIGQLLPDASKATAAEIEKTKDRIQQSVEYMERVWSDDKFNRVRHKCRNQHEE